MAQKVQKLDRREHNTGMSPFNLFVSSADSKSYFPQNCPSDFSIQLREIIHLEGDWTCSLRAIKCVTTTDTDLYVFCDLLEESYVHDTKLPILQYVPGKQGKVVRDFDCNTSQRLISNNISTIRIYIRDFHFKKAPLTGERTTCTLHFEKI